MKFAKIKSIIIIFFLTATTHALTKISEDSCFNTIEKIKTSNKKGFFLLELIQSLGDEEEGISLLLLKNLFFDLYGNCLTSFNQAKKILHDPSLFISADNNYFNEKIVIPKQEMVYNNIDDNRKKILHKKILTAMLNRIENINFDFDPVINEMCFHAHRIWKNNNFIAPEDETFLPLIFKCLKDNNYNERWISEDKFFYDEMEPKIPLLKNKKIANAFYLYGGLFFFHQQQLKKAEYFFKMVLKLEGKQDEEHKIRAHVMLSTIAFCKGDVANAQKHILNDKIFRKYSTSKNNSYWGSVLKGEYYLSMCKYFFMKNNYEAALDFANQAIQQLFVYALIFSDPLYLDSISLINVDKQTMLNKRFLEKYLLKLPMLVNNKEKVFLVSNENKNNIESLQDLEKNKYIFDKFMLEKNYNTPGMFFEKTKPVDRYAPIVENYPSSYLVQLFGAYSMKYLIEIILKIPAQYNQATFLANIEKLGFIAKTKRNIIVNQQLQINALLYYNKSEEALNLAEDLIKKNKRNGNLEETVSEYDLLYILGKIFLEKGRLKEAKDCFQQYIKMVEKAGIFLQTRSFSNVLLKLCEVNLLSKQFGEAQKNYNLHLYTFGKAHPTTDLIFNKIAQSLIPPGILQGTK